MHSTEIGQFTDMLDAVCSALSRGAYKASDANTALYFRALQRYPLAVVRAAFDAHVADPRRGCFVPVPADLIAQIDAMQSDDGRLGAEEAWALALRSQNEAETIVWTTEVAEAFKAARSVLADGDGVGARMAFKEAYGRIVRTARAECSPVHWLPSLGTDPARRDQALAEGIAAGLLPAPDARPTGFAGEPLQLVVPRANVLLLEGGAAAGADDEEHEPVPAPLEARAALRALRERLAARADGPSADSVAREATAAAQADARAKLLTVDETIALVAEVRAHLELLATMRERAATQHLQRGAR